MQTAQTGKKVVLAHATHARMIGDQVGNHIPKSAEAKTELIINHASMVLIKNVKMQIRINGS